MPLVSFTEFEVPDEVQDGGSLRVKNIGGTEVQRLHIVDNSKQYTVQADLAEVVHGVYGEKADDYGTLIGIFNTQGTSNRFKKATIDVTFGDDEQDLNWGPGVTGISPYRHISLHPTTRHVDIRRAANGAVGGGAFGLDISGGLEYERTVGEDQEACTTLEGIILFEGRNSGDKNRARWVLSENPHQKKGFPAFFRGIILLKRTDMEKFTADVTIDVEVHTSVSNKFRSLFSKDEKDDPEIFDPKPAAQPRRSAWSDHEHVFLDKLSDSKIGELDIILSTTERTDRVKGR